MTEFLEQEIRTLRSLFWSERDPDGRGFAPLADACRRAGDSKQAIELLDDGIGRHPGFAPGHVVASRLYMDLAFFEEAERAARKALELDVENVEALRSLAGALEGKGAEDEAVEVRDRLSVLEPAVEAAAEAAAEADEPFEEPAGEIEVSVEDAADAVEEAADLVEDAADSVEQAADSIEEDDAEAEQPVEEPAAEAEQTAEETDVDDLTLDASAFGEADHGDRETLEYVEPGEEMEEIDVGLSDLTLDEEPEEEESVAEEEPMVDLGALLSDEPEEVEEEPMVDLGALAPDEPEEVEEEPVMDLGALAPDEPEEAEEGPVMDLGALAPDEPEEVDEQPVMDLAALAPDEPEAGEEEPVMDLAALAPDEPEAGEEEPVINLAALAPDEPEAGEEEPVMDLADLAPDEPEAGDEEPVMDLADLAPDEPEVMDLADLAPDEPEAVDDEQEAPGAGMVGNILSEEAADAPLEEFNEAPIQTRTIAELYVTQGATARAVEVYKSLIEANPGDNELVARLADLETRVAEEGPGASHDEDEEEVESLARDLAKGGDHTQHEVDTPFAWTEAESVETESDAPPVGDYFSRLLGWEPAREADDDQDQT